MILDSAKVVVTLPEVTVFAASGPVAQNFTSEQIRKTNAQTAAEFLETIPGVSIRRDGVSGGFATIKIGGSNANQVLVLVDGVVWNDVGSGEANLGAIPSEWVESLKVYRGSTTTLGGEAIGGIVEINTKRVHAPEVSGSLSTTEFERELSLSRGGVSNKIYWFAAYSRSQGEGDYKFRITEEDGNGPFTEHLGETFSRDNNHLKRDRLTANFGAPLGRLGTVRLSGWLDEAEYGMPGYLAPRPTPLASADESRRAISLHVREDLKLANLELTATHSERNYFYSDPDPQSWIHSSHESTQRSAANLFATESAANTTIAQSLGIQRERIGSATIAGNEAERWKWNSGLLFSREVISCESSDCNLRANAGLRVEQFGAFDPVALPDASLSYSRDSGLSQGITVSASKAYRAPSFYDLFWDDELLSLGNPELEPETSSLYRAEVFLKAGEKYKSGLYVSAQDNQVENLIYWHPAFDGHWTPDNLRSASLRSLQLEVSRTWVPEHLESQISFEWLEARDRSGDRLTDGKFLIYRAPRTARASVNAKWSGWRLHGEYQWSDKQYVLETNSKWLAEYQVLDAGLSHSIDFRRVRATFGVEVRNVLNNNYRVVRHAPMPLRQVGVNLTISNSGKP